MIARLVRARAVFFLEALRSLHEVGAFTCTSSLVARAVAEPLARLAAPRRVLEVGPGTGAVTRELVRYLRAGDRLDLYEINERFARLLQGELAAVRGPEVNVVNADVATLATGARYDLIVSSLPLMNFEPAWVERVLDLYAAHLAPGGTISSFEYWGNGVRAYLGTRAERERVRAVRRVTEAFHARHTHRCRVIPWNVPPARVHHSCSRPRG